jgi:undecaprenyl-diphosphatase
MLAALFGYVAQNVHTGATLAFDQQFLRSINEQSTKGLDTFFLIATEFGGVIFVSVVSALSLAYLLYRRRRYDALLLAVGVGGAALLNYTAKLTFVRERPDLWNQLIQETTYSFPSGHAAGSSALAVCIVALLWRTKCRIPALIIAPLYIVLIGFSRMYLGVHYLTDIVAGWIVGISWTLIIISIIYYRRKKRAFADERNSESSASL